MNKGICFVVPVRDSIGGITTWFNLIEKKCIEKDIHYFVINKGTKNSEKLKKNFIDKYISPLLLISKQKKQLKKIRNDVSVLHIATSGGNGLYRDSKLLKLAKKLGIKTVLHLHYGKLEEDYSSLRRKKYFDECIKYCDSIISIDPKTHEFLNNNKIDNLFINNPVEIGNYEFNKDLKDFIFVGQIRKEKGVLELLDAFKQYSEENREYSLKFVGPISEEIKEEFLAKCSQNIRYIGQLSHEETLKEIASSRCLILPSYTEASPNVILEAMSFGVPCIANNVGNISNMIIDSGIVTINNSVETIIKALKDMENAEKLDEFSRKSYERVKSIYSLDIVINELLKVWEL